MSLFGVDVVEALVKDPLTVGRFIYKTTEPHAEVG